VLIANVGTAGQGNSIHLTLDGGRAGDRSSFLSWKFVVNNSRDRSAEPLASVTWSKLSERSLATCTIILRWHGQPSVAFQSSNAASMLWPS